MTTLSLVYFALMAKVVPELTPLLVAFDFSPLRSVRVVAAMALSSRVLAY